MNTNKRAFVNIWEYIFVVITALQCDSIYLFSTSSLRINMNVLNILWQLTLIILLFSVFEISNINNKFFLYMGILFVLLGSIFVYDGYTYPNFKKDLIIKLLVDPILLFVLFSSFNNKRYVKSLFIKFENVILFLSSSSLLFWVVHEFHIPANINLFSTWGKTQEEVGYFGLSFFSTKEATAKFLGMNLFRNSGIFAEPSIYSYVLIVALLIELFIKNNNTILNYKILIFLCTILSTISTTGILIAFPAYIYYVLVNHSNGKINTKMLILCLLPFIFILLKIAFVEKFGTTANVGNIYSSFNIRSDDIHAGLKAWEHHIFFGCGLGNNSVIVNNMSSWRFLTSDSPSNSAGLSTVLAQGGLMLGSFYIIPQIIISKYSFKLLGLSIFLFIPFIFIEAQNFYIYIMLLTYFCYLSQIKKKFN